MKKLATLLPFTIPIGLVLVAIGLLTLYPANNLWFVTTLLGLGLIFTGTGTLAIDMIKGGK